MTSQSIQALNVDELYTELESSPNGLSDEAVQERLALYGANVLSEPVTSPLWHHFTDAITHPMALLLWVAGVTMLIIGHPALAVVIWLVVLINGSFSFWQEYWADRAVNGLKHFLPACTRVIRDREDRVVPVSDLVPGDILVLAEGDHVPADARVVEEYGLRVNSAALTGEAIPVRKTSVNIVREELTELEQPNLIFAGTSVVSGTARAVVYATGMLTQFGRIAKLTQAVKEAPSPISQEMARLTRMLSMVALGIGAVILLVATTDLNLPLHEAIILAIGIIVAIVPEGLNPTVTLTLAIGVQRLAKKGVLVKKLSTLETLGNISVLCTDKSGTLTQNQMTVRKLWISGRRFNVSGVGYDPKGHITCEKALSATMKDDLDTFLTAGLLCNNARLLMPLAKESPKQSSDPARRESPFLSGSDQPRWGALGDQTEAALLTLALKGGVEDTASEYPRIHELPFDARRKRMSTIHRCLPGGEVALVKGSPREVLQLCSQILWQGQSVALTNELRDQVMAENDGFARQALRVLALARRDLPERTGAYTVDGVERNLTFLGLAAMMDPPRPEVARAIDDFRSAGIRIVMITGDYGITAESMARRVGMIGAAAPRIVTGAELEVMSDEDLSAILDDEVIFARMAPDHKLRLVSAYQAQGEVVAVVGDGVNDVPALRKADIGVAMGLAGTDVARESADVILTQDNFELIAEAVKEGRAVYDNLRKFITYIFASNIPEVIPFLLAGLFNIPLALTVVQILLIDLGTDLFQSLALGSEKPEPDILNRPPRQRGCPLIDRGLLIRSLAWLGPLEALFCYAGFSMVYFMNTGPALTGHPGLDFLGPLFYSSHGSMSEVDVLASTVFFAGVITAQVGNAFACRSEKGNVRWLGLLSNPWLIVSIGLQILLLLGWIYIQPLASFLRLVPLPPAYWIWLALFAPGLYALERIRKSIFRSIKPKNCGGTA